MFVALFFTMKFILSLAFKYFIYVHVFDRLSSYIQQPAGHRRKAMLLWCVLYQATGQLSLPDLVT